MVDFGVGGRNAARRIMNAGAESGTDSAGQGPVRWLTAWPDALAFAAGLAMAWFLDWDVRDLVWGLWLSSLLVGYSIIVWTIFGPAIFDFIFSRAGGVTLPERAALAGVRMFGGLFLLAFFTVHFGMFHYIHSIFLNHFFPVLDGRPRNFSPTMALYLVVLRRYWPFVLTAAVAERGAFRARPAARTGTGFTEAYKNVLRMHVLIFLFAFAHFARLENFAVYAVVYAVYFFPWRLLRRAGPSAEPGPLGRAGSPLGD